MFITIVPESGKSEMIQVSRVFWCGDYLHYKKLGEREPYEIYLPSCERVVVHG